MTDEIRSKIELHNPEATYYVEAEEDGSQLELHVDLYGPAGERVRIKYDSSTNAWRLLDLLQRAFQEISYAEEHGIHALVEKVGRKEDDVLTTEDLERFLGEDD